jgi:ubiquinone/menaquinone biosynthesis C-methylase UbiE
MPDYAYIYAHQADEYDRLVAREDHEGQLGHALVEIIPDGLDVIESGAGTGRLSLLLAGRVRSLRAFDRSAAMLSLAAARLRRSGLKHWLTALADHRALPVPPASADVILSGWSLCYLALDSGRAWQAELDAGLAAFARALRPGGRIVLIETLGTGHEAPERPLELRPYLSFLDSAGFTLRAIRTDYRFASVDEARALVPFFFGEAMLDRVEARQAGLILPECTGIWWKTL